MKGVYVFDKYNAIRIDPQINIKDLIASAYISNACAGLLNNRYYKLAYTPTGSTVNSKILIFDTLNGTWVSEDEGYYPRCFFNLSGGADTSQLFFGTGKNLGLIYQDDTGTTDGSPVTDGTNVNIDLAFETTEFVQGANTQKSKARRVKIAADISAGGYFTTTLSRDGGKQSVSKVCADTRTSATWGTVANGGSGLKWGTVANGGSGAQWGSSVQENVFTMNVPETFHKGHNMKVKVSTSISEELSSISKTLRIREIALMDRPTSLD
jgi:hypothetical protein